MNQAAAEQLHVELFTYKSRNSPPLTIVRILSLRHHFTTTRPPLDYHYGRIRDEVSNATGCKATADVPGIVGFGRWPAPPVSGRDCGPRTGRHMAAPGLLLVARTLPGPDRMAMPPRSNTRQSAGKIAGHGHYPS